MQESICPSARDKEIAAALTMQIMAICAESFDVLEKLYSELRIGGGFFTGRQMSEEVGKATRCEVIAYASALTRIYMIEWQNPTVNVGHIISVLEPALFSLQLTKVRPVYDDYVARYNDIRPQDSSVLPRAGVVSTQFSQKLLRIWGFTPRPSSSEFSKYSDTLITLTHRIESIFQTSIGEIKA